MRDIISELKKEMTELNSKLFKLHCFLTHDDVFNLIDEQHYSLMSMQLDAMRIYSGVLCLRIKDLEAKDES